MPQSNPAEILSQLAEKNILVLNPDIPRGHVCHVLFDFDGTLSLIREGWQDVMIPMMLEVLQECASDEPLEQMQHTVREYVTRLTGKQTIYQMIELAEQVRRRGGKPKDPLEYKYEYLARLEVRIQQRIEGLQQRSILPHQLLVPGSIALLEDLRQYGARLYLASGTDEPFVLREARLLGIDEYFDGGIYGALDDYQNFSKQKVIDRIIRENGLEGPELLGIGDGYVEIENTKSVGGIALGLPTFESNPIQYDEWKKERLTQAGADLLAPNFLEYDALVRYLCDLD